MEVYLYREVWEWRYDSTTLFALAVAFWLYKAIKMTMKLYEWVQADKKLEEEPKELIYPTDCCCSGECFGYLYNCLMLPYERLMDF